MLTQILLFAVQAAPAPPPESPTAPKCMPGAHGKDIVVCGRADQEQFRLRPIPSRFERKTTGPGLEFDLGDGAKANLYAAAETSPDHKPDNRVMATVRIPF